jgi:tetratricopeptide (TPR) repeat protein
MAIQISCSCSKQLRLKDHFAGKRVKCPACGQGLTVPAQENGKPADAHGPAPAAEGSPFDFFTGAPASEPAASAFDFSAPPPEPIAAPAAAVPPAPAPEPAKTSVGPGQPSAAPRARFTLAAIIAGFTVILGGLIYGLVLLLSGAEDSSGVEGGAGNGGSSGADKLRLEKEKARLAQSRTAANGAGQGDGRAAAQAKRKQEAEQAAERSRLAEAKRKADEAEKARLAEAKRKADEAEKARLAEAKRQAAEAEKVRVAQDKQRRAETARKLAQDGEAALAARQYDKAIAALVQASQLAPDDRQVKDNLDRARKKQSAKLKEEGHAHLKAKKYEAALAALGEANRLNPDDRSVAHDLEKARTVVARKQARATAKMNLEKGRAALKEKRYPEAVQALTEASSLAPNDPVAKSLLQQARLGLARVQEAQAKKNRKEAAALVEKGRAALAEKRYQDAVAALSQASALDPMSRSTRLLLQKAQKALQETQLAAAAERKKQDEARKRQEELKRAEQLRDLLGRAKQALAAGKLDEADKLLAQAKQLSPSDLEIAGLLQNLVAARKAIADARLAEEKNRAEAVRHKRLEEFKGKMAAGKKALAGDKFQSAIKEFAAALQLVQNDKQLTGQQKEAKAALEDAKKKLTAAGGKLGQ